MIWEQTKNFLGILKYNLVGIVKKQPLVKKITKNCVAIRLQEVEPNIAQILKEYLPSWEREESVIFLAYFPGNYWRRPSLLLQWREEDELLDEDFWKPWFR